MGQGVRGIQVTVRYIFTFFFPRGEIEEIDVERGGGEIQVTPHTNKSMSRANHSNYHILSRADRTSQEAEVRGKERVSRHTLRK